MLIGLCFQGCIVLKRGHQMYLRQVSRQAIRGLVAGISLMGLGVAWGADYWSTYSGTAGAPAASLSGALHGTAVTIANQDNNYSALLYLNNGIAWGNSNAGIYPASFSSSSYEFVRSPNASTLSPGSPTVASIQFAQPVIDPILIFYSLDNSGVTVQGTKDSAGANAVVAIQSNQPSMIDVATLSVAGPYPPGAATGLEGCIAGSRRVCGVFRFTGSYSALQLGQFVMFGGQDGVGFQLGMSITPAATDDAGTAVAGTASVAVANIRGNDKLVGAQGTTVPADAANTVIAVDGSWPSGFDLNTATGAVSVAGSVAIGTYTLPYRLCDAADAENCVDANITIVVAAPPPPPAATPVPALNAAALALLGLLMAGVGTLYRRRARA
ncbi:MAG: IPTL-CTERM sorting domain-containing protein [Comamonas sp.]